MKECAMERIDLDRYLRDENLRAALDARAHRERAETVYRLLVTAGRWLGGLPARVRQRLAALQTPRYPATRMGGCH
jgi:hypothetical protein